jgi:uncharacterized protein (TIGR02145 family)
LAVTGDLTDESARTLTAYVLVPPVAILPAATTLTITANTAGNAAGYYTTLNIPAGDAFEAGKCYTFNHAGTTSTPVTVMTTYTEMSELANSYMVHPSATTRRYRIPVKRVNDYWGNTTLAGYGNAPSSVLASGSAWDVSYSWSDMPVGSSLNLATSGTYTGTQANDYFSFDIPANTAAGNFVVNVINGSDEVLWSWHLWVTDYDPDAWLAAHPDEIEPGEAKAYTFTGGQVESYGGTAWASGGLLYGKVMMDRFLGELAPNASYASNLRGSLHYQWGRKDPFPALSLLTLGTVSTVSGQTTVVNAVQHPTTFYVHSGDWTSETGVNTGTFIWHDPAAITASIKSIYDPCPPGWRVPEQEAWADFIAYTNAEWQDSPAGMVYPKGSSKYAFYSAGLSRTSSSVSTSPVRGVVWANTPKGGSSSISNFLSYNQSSLQSSTTNRAYGYSVRCVQR